MKTKIALIQIACLMMMLCATSQTKIAKSQEKDPQHQYHMGLYYLNSSQLDLSIKHLKMSLSLEPQNHLTLNALGLVYLMKRNLEESVKYFTECLKIKPNLAEAHNNLGSVYQEMGLLDKANEHFISASLDTLNTSGELPFYNLARLYFTQDNMEDALLQVQQSLKLKNDFPRALNLEGLILSKMGQMDDAIRSFEKALKINPVDINVDFNLAEAYFNNGQFEKAKQKFNTIYLKSSDAEMKKKIADYLRKIK